MVSGQSESSYRIYYQVGSSTFTLVNGLPTVAFVTASAPATSVVIPSLTIGSTYFFQVYAVYTPGPTYSAGVTSGSLLLTAPPDSTSTLSCSGYSPVSGFEPVGTALTCTITPRLAGVVVTSTATSFVVSASTGMCNNSIVSFDGRHSDGLCRLLLLQPTS